MKKLYEILSIFFLGIIAGISFYIKFLDKPETQVNIKKIKNKNSEVEQPLNVEVNNIKEKKKLFRRNDK